MATQLREPVSVPQRVEALADREIQRTRSARRPGEKMLACVRLRLAAAKPPLQLGPGERRQVERRRRVGGQRGVERDRIRSSRGERDPHLVQDDTMV